MLDLIGNGRPAGDLLSRVVRITLGGREYALPVLTIGGNRRWQRLLDQRLGALLTALEDGGDDLPAIFGALSQQVDDLVTLLLSYECPERAGAPEAPPCTHLAHLLPSRTELEEQAYEDELLRACQEVWRAANPLVGTTIEALGRTITAAELSASSEPTNGPQPSTAGRRARSKPS